MQVGRTPPGPQQQYPSQLPGPPTAAAFHKLMTSTLHDADWPMAARLALWCASSHKDAAQTGLEAALAGARKAAQDSRQAAVPPDRGSSTLPLVEQLHAYWQESQQVSSCFRLTTGNRAVLVCWPRWQLASFHASQYVSMNAPSASQDYSSWCCRGLLTGE